MLRLDRILANSGLGSRKEVKQLIRQGRIKLGEKTLTRPELLLSEEEAASLCFDGQRLRTSRWLYYILNKPAGYITDVSRRSQATIREFLPDFFADKKITPAGRLDKDTTGLLILTNHGLVIHRLLSPRYQIPRVYYLEADILSHPFCPEDAARIAAGIRLNDEETARPAELEILSDNSARLKLYEGKFHEVKRIMHAVGKEVTLLHREAYGPLRLRDEAPGSLRELSEEETAALLAAVDLDEGE